MSEKDRWFSLPTILLEKKVYYAPKLAYIQKQGYKKLMQLVPVTPYSW